MPAPQISTFDQLRSFITTNFPDNNSGLVDPEDVRVALRSFVDIQSLRNDLMTANLSPDQAAIWQELINKLDQIQRESKSGITGTVTQGNAPTPYDAVTYPNGLFETYVVRTPLTIPNSWGFAVTQAELDANYVYFDVRNGVVSKEVSLKPTIETVAVIDPNGTKATQEKAVADYTKQQLDKISRDSVNLIDTTKFRGGYYKINGTFTSSTNQLATELLQVPAIVKGQKITVSGGGNITSGGVKVIIKDINNLLLLVIDRESPNIYPYTFTVPLNANTWGFTIVTDSKNGGIGTHLTDNVFVNSFQVQVGEVATKFEKFDSKYIKNSSLDIVLPEISQALDPFGTKKVPSEKAVADYISTQIYYKEGDNSHNPDTDSIGTNISASGVVSVNEVYNLTDYIPVKSQIRYKSNMIIRRIACFDINRNFISTIESTDNFITANNCAFVRLMYSNVTVLPKNMFFGEFDKDINTSYNISAYDKFGRKFEMQNMTENVNVLNLSNSDKILLIGSSSTESLYSLPNKSWIQKLNMFSDWTLLGYGFAGYSADQVSDALAIDTPTISANGVPPSAINPTFIYVGQFGNMSSSGIDDSDSESFIESNRRLIRVAKAVTGGEVIIGTGYTTYSKPFLVSALANLAEEENGYFMPIGYDNDNIIRKDSSGFRAFKGFYGGAHPGTRTNAFYAQGLLNYLQRFRKPSKAINIYRPRTGIVDFVYSNPIEKLKKFYSIQMGERSLSDDKFGFYDNLEPDTQYKPFAVRNSEYLALLNGGAIELKEGILIEGILDKINCDNVVFKFEIEGAIESVSIFNPITNTYGETSFVTENGGYKIDCNYIEFDKVRIFIKGGGKIKNPSFQYKGGSTKIVKESDINIFPKEYILDGGGQNWGTWSNIGTPSIYTQIVDFIDIPNYLPENSSILKLDTGVSKNGVSKILPITAAKGASKRFMLEIYARMNPKIYDVEKYDSWVGLENPYTNVVQITPTSFDYGVLRIEFGGTQLSIKKVPIDLFWSKIQVPLYLPAFTKGEISLKLIREIDDTSIFPMEISDVKMFEY